MNKTIYALGFFDGVHLGHAALLRQCRHMADSRGCDAGAVTFSAHPQSLVKGDAPALINSLRDRQTLLRRCGHVDRVVTLPFDEEMRNLPWEAFLELLCREYGAAGFVCGEDFRFGARGRGNARLLEQWCQSRNLPFAAVADQTLDGVRISSTGIRQRLEDGDMAGAVGLLGHPHILTGTVIHGQGLGHRLGFPTANLVLPEGLVIPRFGVYACACTLDGRTLPAVTNIGTRPTVAGRSITVEPWILDYSGDLYGRDITLEFYEFLRPEQKFDSLEALRREIMENARQTRAYFREAGFTDRFQSDSCISPGDTV